MAQLLPYEIIDHIMSFIKPPEIVTFTISIRTLNYNLTFTNKQLSDINRLSKTVYGPNADKMDILLKPGLSFAPQYIISFIEENSEFKAVSVIRNETSVSASLQLNWSINKNYFDIIKKSSAQIIKKINLI